VEDRESFHAAADDLQVRLCMEMTRVRMVTVSCDDTRSDCEEARLAPPTDCEQPRLLTVSRPAPPRLLSVWDVSLPQEHHHTW